MSRLFRELINTGLIAAGVLSAGMGLKGFLLSSNFIDGGVTGVSMLLAKTTGLPLALWLRACPLAGRVARHGRIESLTQRHYAAKQKCSRAADWFRAA